MLRGNVKTLLICLSCWLFYSFLPNRLFCQYILNGSAKQVSCNCYILTNEVKNQSGSVWNANKISLANSFDFHFNVYLGCLDSIGADGIVFILQPVSTSVGTIGEGMGFQGVSPSVGISLDTWQNPGRNDPWFDHISIQLNGQITHGNDLAGPVPASATSYNIEDCKWHVLRITWDATTKTITTYFDGQFRLQVQYDLVGKVFNNNPMVYWGFSGGTGSGVNLQQFCTSLSPFFSAGLPDSSVCLGAPIVFSDQSESFTSIKNFYWDFDDGTTSNLQSPPPHTYSSPGNYVVKHAITGMDGCVSDTMKKMVDVGAKPVADFSLYDACTNKILGVTDRSSSAFGTISSWNWILDGIFSSSNQQPAFANLSSTTHQLKLSVKSIYGCASDTVTKAFQVYPAPVVAIAAGNGCWEKPVKLSSMQIDNLTDINQWKWIFDDGSISSDKDPVHVYAQGGLKTIHLSAVGSNGCVSNDTIATINIEDVFVDAGRDTSVQSNIPFTLAASWAGHFTEQPNLTWTPATGLSSVHDVHPVSVLQNDQEYYVTATTNEGCSGVDSIKVSVFNFPGVLVPTAFTPNHDALNDLLRPRYNGIKHLDHFTIYNRWGQLVFDTSEMDRGWDGSLNGNPQSTGVYVWIITAEGFDGRQYQLKGITSIIR